MSSKPWEFGPHTKEVSEVLAIASSGTPLHPDFEKLEQLGGVLIDHLAHRHFYEPVEENWPDDYQGPFPDIFEDLLNENRGCLYGPYSPQGITEEVWQSQFRRRISNSWIAKNTPR